MEYGCIGERLSHSFSKTLHNKIGNYNYILKEIPQGSLPDFIRSKAYKGINVTIPYKKAVMPYLDEIEANAKKIGAVNTIVNNEGFLYGYNTDFEGMISLIKRLELDLKNKLVLILGTGGTSFTALEAVKSLNCKKALRVSRESGRGDITYLEAYEKYNNAEIIINTTPCGMYPNTQETPIDISLFPKLEGVVDVIYNPLSTRLVLSAKAKKIRACGGLYMLISQGVLASEKFFNKKYPLEFTENIYRDILKEKTNIVLIGMPGSGKTTIGKAVSKALKREFLDTDDFIFKSYGKTPQEIISSKGVKAFREIEKEAVNKIKNSNSLVISTGGGVVLDKENIENLSLNSRIYFIDRPLESLNITSDRPLSDTKEKLFSLYSQRIDLYNSYCHKKIDNRGEISSAVNKIIEDFERLK